MSYLTYGIHTYCWPRMHSSLVHMTTLSHQLQSDTTIADGSSRENLIQFNQFNQDQSNNSSNITISEFHINLEDQPDLPPVCLQRTSSSNLSLPNLLRSAFTLPHYLQDSLTLSRPYHPVKSDWYPGRSSIPKKRYRDEHGRFISKAAAAALEAAKLSDNILPLLLPHPLPSLLVKELTISTVLVDSTPQTTAGPVSSPSSSAPCSPSVPCLLSVPGSFLLQTLPTTSNNLLTTSKSETSSTKLDLAVEPITLLALIVYTLRALPRLTLFPILV